MFYIFLIAVLLLNFLIAVMSTSAAEVGSRKRILFLMTRLSLALCIENRMYWIAKRYAILRHIYKMSCYEGGTISLATLILGHCKSWFFHHYCDVLHPRNKWNLLSKEYLHRHWKKLWLWVRGVSKQHFQHFFTPKNSLSSWF